MWRASDRNGGARGGGERGARVVAVAVVMVERVGIDSTKSCSDRTSVDLRMAPNSEE